ncbi:MAG: preQ(1) synthase [Elusimicrobiota bacterium]|jgi:7-cyano-7-deazaguanine reductase|nr:preQ(1) synthase [Elusimicrobiota bacterium]
MEKKMPVFDKVSPQLLEAMPYQYIGKDIDVNIETEEFTCLCPWTGLPDYALLTVSYTPDKTVVELKSLKLYLQSYRMVGIVHESVVNKITEDLSSVLKPKRMTVELKFGIRGGITTTVKRDYIPENIR